MLALRLMEHKEQDAILLMILSINYLVVKQCSSKNGRYTEHPMSIISRHTKFLV